MAKKVRAAAPTPAAAKPTKRQVSRLRQEQRNYRILYLAMAATAVVVIGLVVFGILREQVLLPSETVLTVNGASFNRETYWKLRRYDIGSQLQQLSFQAQFNQGNPEFIRQRMTALQEDLRQYRSRPLDVPTLERMANKELMRQRANLLGVTIDEAALQAEVEREFAPPPATSTPVTTAEATATSAAATAAATLTPAPSLTATRAPITGTPGTPAPTATPTIGPTVTSTPFQTATPTPPPTPMDEAARATAGATFREQSASLRQLYGFTADDYRTLVVRPRLLETAIKAKLAEQSPAVQPQVRAAHILVVTEEEAKQAKAQLDGGADFAAIAREKSTDPSNKDKGGDLDWFPRGIMAPEFETAAFAQPVGVVGEPVKTQFGWHIIKVIEKSDTRPATDSLVEQRRETLFENWMKEQRANSTVTSGVTLPAFAPTPTPGPTPTDGESTEPELPITPRP